MWRYAELLSERTLAEIQRTRAEVADGKAHPMEFKKALAQEIVLRFHGANAAAAAREYFETRFQRRQAPKNIRTQFSPPERIGICQLLVDLNFARSKREARGLVAQGAVRVDGQAVSDINFEFQKKLHRLVEVGKMRIAEAAE
jgi:tyrosyl-tRNA synthetase